MNTYREFLTSALLTPKSNITDEGIPTYSPALKQQGEWVIRNSTAGTRQRDVPLFVEHCEAVAAEMDIKRRWLGEQGRRGLSFLSGVLPGQHVTLEVACEPSVVGSLWPLPA
jgi:hypothetical protein